MKVFAPVITHDVTLPDSAKKVPMLMVPVPESRTLMAIPISTLNQLNETHIMDHSASLKLEEQQAKELLIWNNGIGFLDGCDLRFKINQLGCLELLDSDDEENQNYSSSSRTTSRNNNNNNRTNNRLYSNPGTITTATSTANSTPTPTPTSQPDIQQQQPQQQQYASSNPVVKEISPGSSLLLGPKTKRPKSSSSSSNNNTLLSNNNTSTNRNQLLQKHQNHLRHPQLHQNCQSQHNHNNQRQKQQQQQQADKDNSDTTINDQQGHLDSKQNILLELSRLSDQNKMSIIMDKLVSKEKVEEIKKANNVLDWTTGQIKEFIDSIPGCSGCGELFESQQICGKSLMYLTLKDLLDVINIKLGPAVKIYHAILLIK